MNSLVEDIKAIATKSEHDDSEGFEIDSIGSGRDEEIKIANNLRFSLHEFNPTQMNDNTKETRNNTTDEIVDIEMIKVSTAMDKSEMKHHKAVKKGIKLITNSLKSTTNTMKTLLDLLLGEEPSTTRERNKSRNPIKLKRSNSLFS